MTNAVMLDLSGVLYSGDSALPGAADAVRRLRDAGLPLRFLTNSTRTPKRGLLEKLHGFGIKTDPGELFTPAQAAADLLRAEGWTPHLLVHPDLEEDFAACPAGDRVAVVVGDAGRHFTYDRLNVAFRRLSEGAPFLALAANRVFLDADDRLSMDAGAFVKALEYASGIEPRLLGKPAPEFFRAAAESMGCALGDAAMIGDDAEADVAGALSAGLGRAILVQTGKYRPGDEARVTPAPSAVAADVDAAVDLLLG